MLALRLTNLQQGILAFIQYLIEDISPRGMLLLCIFEFLDGDQMLHGLELSSTVLVTRHVCLKQGWTIKNLVVVYDGNRLQQPLIPLTYYIGLWWGEMQIKETLGHQ